MAIFLLLLLPATFAQVTGDALGVHDDALSQGHEQRGFERPPDDEAKALDGVIAKVGHKKLRLYHSCL